MMRFDVVEWVNAQSFSSWSGMAQIYQSDALEALRRMPAGSVDCVITDPAYCSLEKHRTVGTTTRLTTAWFPVVPNDYYVPLFAELMRVTAKNAHFYCFCDAETDMHIRLAAQSTGWVFWNALTWDKQRMGMGYHYRRQKEHILFFEKGKRGLNYPTSIPDILGCSAVRGGYPTEKPVELAQLLILQSTKEGETVLDPFMGSAFVGAAAQRTSRCFVGVDVSEASLVRASERLGVLPGTLPAVVAAEPQQGGLWSI